MSKIKSIGDIPKWFDIDNYRAAESFGAIDWYAQLKQRQFIFTLLDYRKDKSSDLSKQAEKSFELNIEHLRGKDIRLTNIPNFFGDRSLAEHLKSEKQVIHSLTFRHLHDHAKNFDALDQPTEKWLNRLNSQCEETPYTKNNEVDQPLILSTYLSPKEHIATANVNLNLPDALLIKGFASWLEQVRRSRGEFTNKRYHQPVLKRWAQNGLLPFIDLEIWRLETGSKLPDRIMAATLFPRLDFGEENIRKSTRPLAQSLMNDLSELQAIAALESKSHEDSCENPEI